MSSNTPHQDVQRELEGLSPILARLRKQGETETASSTDMDRLHSLGSAALQAVPLDDSPKVRPESSLRVVHRKRTWIKAAAAAIALMIGSLLTFSIYSSAESDSNYARTNAAISAELVASFEAETADPLAFLLDDESYTFEDNELMFSPVEDVLLDWADDGQVDEALSQEVIFDALK